MLQLLHIYMRLFELFNKKNNISYISDILLYLYIQNSIHYILFKKTITMFQPFSPPKLVVYVLIVTLIFLFIFSLVISYLSYLIIYMNCIQFITKSTTISEMLIYTEHQEHVTKFIGSKASIVYL